MPRANDLRITTLVDNYVGRRGLMAEHGSSMLIESGDSAVLLDCGQTALALRNAKKLGVELARVQAIVLSHGHIDHTGGLAPVLRYLRDNGCRVTVYAHPNALEAKYSEEDARLRSIGIRLKPEQVRRLGGELVVSTKPVEVAPGIWTSGEIPRNHGPQAVDKKFRARRDSCICEDHLPDDQFVWAAVPGGTAVISGCCHAGLENSLYHAIRLSGNSRLRLVVGGLHLLKLEEGELLSITSGLKPNPPDSFVIGHCTGFKAMVAFNNAFPGRVSINAAGLKIEVGKEITLT